MSRTSYAELVDGLSAVRPTTAALLKAAHDRRVDRLAKYADGVRLRGIEELLVHLAGVRDLFAHSAPLRPVAFLIERARGEFVTALEAALAALHSVAHDSMRAVMEIEFLLRDFGVDPARLVEWARADAKTLDNRFRPAVLRQRWATHVGESVESLPEARDYKGHSMFLHVGKARCPFGVSGLASDEAGIATESCFGEVFEHGRRLLIAIQSVATAHDVDLIDPAELDAVGEAWERTQEMQQLWLQMMGTPGQDPV